MYFIAKMQGKYIVDPFKEVQEQFVEDSGSDAAEKDSNDSNRESAE